MFKKKKENLSREKLNRKFGMKRSDRGYVVRSEVGGGGESLSD